MGSITPGRYYVYVLARPDGRPFYVGKATGRRSKGVNERPAQHEAEARSGCRCHKCNVIRKIWRQGGVVQVFTILATDDEAEALAYEQTMINLYGRSTLTNMTDGGEGVSGRIVPAEERERRSVLMKKVMQDPAIRGRINAGIKRANSTPESRALHRSVMKEMWDSPGFREAIAQLHATPEFKARASLAMKKKWEEPDYRAKTSASLAASKRDPEFRAKMSTIKKEQYKNDPELTEKNRAKTPEQRERARRQMSDPAFQARLREAARPKRQTAEYRANMSAKTSAASQKKWADPEFRARMIEIRREQGRRAREARARAAKGQDATPEPPLPGD